MRGANRSLIERSVSSPKVEDSHMMEGMEEGQDLSTQEVSMKPAGESMRAAGESMRTAGESMRTTGESMSMRSTEQSMRYTDESMRFEGVPKRFSYGELSVATGGFANKSKLGQGGFGSVYRGQLASGTLVAVKRMNSSKQSQGRREFEHEVAILIELRHRNLIQLRGWCEDRDRSEYLLVYELAPNGSLDDAVFKACLLSWPQRLNILSGTAAALEYLHQGWTRQVIHRDVKCSNIMLDEDWNAKLGDFGIARVVDHAREAVTSNMVGTFGYIAPELIADGRFTDKADVYAFGVVVLEVLCGRRVLPKDGEVGLVTLVREVSTKKGDLLSVVDKRLTGYDPQQVLKVLDVGVRCTSENPNDRPSMKMAVRLLDLEPPVEPKKHWKLSDFFRLRHSQRSQSSPRYYPKEDTTSTSSIWMLPQLQKSNTMGAVHGGAVETMLPPVITTDSICEEDFPRFASILNDEEPQQRRTIVVAVQAHEKFHLEPFIFVYQNLIEDNARVVVINCLSKIQDEMGVDHRVDVNAITGISKKKLETAVNTQMNNTNHFLRMFRKQLNEKGVELDVWIATGPESHDILIHSAKALNPYWVVLDRSFTHRKKKIQAGLDCNMVLMRKGSDFEALQPINSG